LSHLDVEKQKQLRDLLYAHRVVFNDKPGYCNLLKHQIKLKDGFEPKAFKPYRIPDKIKESVDLQISQLLADGKIRASSSPFASPIECVIKKDSPDIRLCVNYKYLNSGTVVDSFPMPRIDETLRKIAPCTYISTIDATSGYHQIAMQEEDMYKTAFITHRGMYEWKYLPFGLRCSGNTFVRAVNEILRPHDKYSGAYVDDEGIHSMEWSHHLVHVDKVLNAFEEAGTTLKLGKCVGGKKKVIF
jgi:Reverse transcriptase (RNA-dependent DNA polymerase)